MLLRRAMLQSRSRSARKIVLWVRGRSIQKRDVPTRAGSNASTAPVALSDHRAGRLVRSCGVSCRGLWITLAGFSRGVTGYLLVNLRRIWPLTRTFPVGAGGLEPSTSAV